MLQNSRIVAASTAASPTSEANSRCHVTASGSFAVIVSPIASIAPCSPTRQMANYSGCADIAADFISEPSRGTNLDIAATDQIRPIATTMAIAMDVLRMCIPLRLR
jgi:isocitrate/isopropylmalate dehydrogenase